MDKESFNFLIDAMFSQVNGLEVRWMARLKNIFKILFMSKVNIKKELKLATRQFMDQNGFLQVHLQIINLLTKDLFIITMEKQKILNSTKGNRRTPRELHGQMFIMLIQKKEKSMHQNMSKKIQLKFMIGLIVTIFLIMMNTFVTLVLKMPSMLFQKNQNIKQKGQKKDLRKLGRTFHIILRF